MREFKLIQIKMNALCDKEIDRNVIDTATSMATAKKHLEQRGYRYDVHRKQWIQGSAFQYPIVIEKPNPNAIFDIRSFTKQPVIANDDGDDSDI